MWEIHGETAGRMYQSNISPYSVDIHVVMNTPLLERAENSASEAIIWIFRFL